MLGTALLLLTFETARVSEAKGEQLQQEKEKKTKSNLINQIFFESENIKHTWCKAGEAMRRVGSWFNSEFRRSEPLPPEFKDLGIQSECERARDVWQKHF